MGTDLTKCGLRRGGAHALLVLLLTLVVAGCGGDSDTGGPQEANATDVMYAQMTVEHIRQGLPVLDLAVERGRSPELKAVATELRGQWTAENTTLAGWLAEWDRPAEADPNESIHAGHGALHALRPQDVDDLRAATGAFDQTATALLLGHLHNGMETARMEAKGGAYRPAVDLATRTTTTRQAQIQRLLTLAAGQ
ncbi:DUF305 domain-containing protein [Actinoplanes sp. NPDC051470]|uniref:DUF305 domain-containing protein n=1 Tax=Actinoplanes sp. NPDC051470 TaxID=3157224 RepID=UPI003423F4B8